MVGLRAKRPHFTEKWLRFTLHFVAHFYSARNDATGFQFVEGARPRALAHLRYDSSMPGTFESTTLLHILFVIAIIAEAMTAALAAGKREMDWLGVCMLGCVTALGGGTVRDVVLGNHPLTWVQHPIYLLLTGGAALCTIAIARYMHKLRNIFLFLDAVGL